MKRPSIFVAFVVAVLLTLVVAVAALAAPAGLPATQATDDLSGVYVSDVYPAADASGLVQMLALYPNNNAEMLSFYLGKDAPIVELGTWESVDDSLTVTLTGQLDSKYDTPAVTTYTLDGDTLVDGAFVLTRLAEVTPEEMDAAGTAEVDFGAPTSDDPSGTYVSDVYPAADASGLVELLALYPNNNAQMTSFYLGKDAPVVENGTWKLTDDGDVELALTGTPEKEYDKPSVTTYGWGEDILVDGAFVLNLLPVITPEEMDAMTAAPDEDLSGSYVSDVYPAADAPGLITVLTLYPNNNAEQTSIYLTKAAIIEEGTWELGAGNALTVTMTGIRDDKPYNKPDVITYEVDGETLVGSVFELYKLAVVMPRDRGEETAPSPVALFQSDQLIAADSPGRIITLTLYSDSTITFDTDFLNDEPVINEVGTWKEDADGNLTVSITGSPDSPSAEPDVITFEQDGDQIVAVDYNKDMWGTEGLTLTEQPLE